MSDLRKKKIFVTCPNCKGYKGIYGHSALGHPATLPCPQCGACGEVDLDSITTEDLDSTFIDATKRWGW